ncbi:MAG: hypothetical protein EOP04_07055 [Proteobacteria bacterium]|nr:MAG: hypothetical protein EOP04_07055 [Pseudomonadota bacterium]
MQNVIKTLQDLVKIQFRTFDETKNVERSVSLLTKTIQFDRICAILIFTLATLGLALQMIQVIVGRDYSSSSILWLGGHLGIYLNLFHSLYSSSLKSLPKKYREFYRTQRIKNQVSTKRS